jgi:two-component system LytT family sensor kinase
MEIYMQPNFFNKRLFIIIPLVGALIVGVFLISYGIKDTNTVISMFGHGIIMTAGIWLGCMSIVMWLWKVYPWEQAPAKHLLLEIGLILIYTVAFSSCLYFIERSLILVPPLEDIGLQIFNTLLITFFITAIHESIFFYQQWKYNFSKSIRLEKDNLEARYEALRSQINPHFLFNSLNSLTTLVEDNKPAVEYIGNLSDLLRYMLKSGEKEMVLLREEITVLNSYIRLQQMRFTGALNIRLEVPESYYHYAVPPLALQILVENCIKHNIISREKPLWVNIRTDREMIIVENNLQKKEGVGSTGQGLKNLMGRYRYFTTRKVEVEQTQDLFRVRLPLLQVEL